MLLVNCLLITEQAALERLIDMCGELASLDMGGEGPFRNIAQF